MPASVVCASPPHTRKLATGLGGRRVRVRWARDVLGVATPGEGADEKEES